MQQVVPLHHTDVHAIRRPLRFPSLLVLLLYTVWSDILARVIHHHWCLWLGLFLFQFLDVAWPIHDDVSFFRLVTTGASTITEAFTADRTAGQDAKDEFADFRHWYRTRGGDYLFRLIQLTVYNNTSGLVWRCPRVSLPSRWRCNTLKMYWSVSLLSCFGTVEVFVGVIKILTTSRGHEFAALMTTTILVTWNTIKIHLKRHQITSAEVGEEGTRGPGMGL